VGLGPGFFKTLNPQLAPPRTDLSFKTLNHKIKTRKSGPLWDRAGFAGAAGRGRFRGFCTLLFTGKGLNLVF
jgi:hypothetical protein